MFMLEGNFIECNVWVVHSDMAVFRVCANKVPGCIVA